MARTISKIHALCVGIDFYPNQKRDTGDSLAGCCNDALAFARYLKLRGVPPEDITVLTSTLQDLALYTTKESDTDLATYENITNALIRIGKEVIPGDQVIFTYSGHGGREWTLVPKFSNKDSGFDETLVTQDAWKQGGIPWGGIRDFELSYLLEQIVSRVKDVRMTVVLDSCHSGGAFRDAEDEEVLGKLAPRTRSRELPDLDAEGKAGRTRREQVSKMREQYAQMKPLGGVSLGTLKEHWDQMIEKTTHMPTKSSMLKPQAYEIFTGCLQHELSWEIWGNGKLTAALVDTLNSLDAKIAENTSLEMLFRCVFDQIYTIYGKTNSQILQTPVLLGDRMRNFLDIPPASGSPSTAIESTPVDGTINQKIPGIPIHAIPYSKSQEPQQSEGLVPELVMRAGIAHGVQEKSEYAVYLWNQDLLPPKEEHPVRVVVKELYDTVSVIELVGKPSLEKFREVYLQQLKGQETRMKEWYERHPKAERIHELRTTPWPYGCQAVLLSGPAEQVKTVRLNGISYNGDEVQYIRGVVPLHVFPQNASGLEKTPDFLITSSPDGESGVEVQNTDGTSLSRARDVDGALRQIMQISRYHDLHSIGTPEYLVDLQKEDQEYFNLIQEPSDGDKLTFRFQCFIEYTRKQSKNYVNLAVFHFSSDYGVRQIYPIEDPFESVDVGSDKVFYLDRSAKTTASIRGAKAGLQETIRAIVFEPSTNFRTFEMSGLTDEMEGKGNAYFEIIKQPGQPLEEFNPKSGTSSIPGSLKGDFETFGFNKYWVHDVILKDI